MNGYRIVSGFVGKPLHERRTDRMTRTTNPLPSLIRASAWDAGNMQMRAENRQKWNEDDYNMAARTQERLIRGCYGSYRDIDDPNMCYIRFGIAEAMERAGQFHLKSKMGAIHRAIDEAVGG